MQLNALIKPLKLAAAISFVSALTACSGNSSSTSSGPAPIIDPITVNKTMAEVEWNEGNYVANASHAYRVVSKSRMLRYVLTNQLAAFDVFVNILRANSNRNCANSGRLIAEDKGKLCFTDKIDGEKTACLTTSPLTKSEQVSRAFSCQDGVTEGKYLDGFFSTIQIEDSKTDLSLSQTSTTLSALGETTSFDQDGKLIVNEDNDPILTPLTDYLFQSDNSLFFFDHQYESYVDFSTTKLICGKNTYRTIDRQGMRSKEVGTQEGGDKGNFYLYTRLTDLNLESIPVETCIADDKQSVTYTYNLTTTMANAAMGGGENRNTSVSWPNMAISLKGEPSGIMTLVHKNTDTENVTVVVEFRSDGFVSIKRDDETPAVLPLAEFLELSKPPAE